MAIGRWFAAVAFVAGGFVLSAAAQDKPSGTWTDPPVRGSASAPSTDAPSTTAETPSRDKPEETRASAPEKATRPAAATGEAATNRKVSDPSAVRRSANVRRDHIRRLAVRSRDLRIAREERRYAAPARSSRRETGRMQARMERPSHHRRYAWRYARPRLADNRDFDRSEPYYTRRLAGWQGLVGDARARRIASARAAGYLVMRSRTYEFPDGTQVRSLRPMYYDDFD